MAEIKRVELDLFKVEKTKKTEYEKLGIDVLVFQQDDVVRTSFVQETGGDTYAGDLDWFGTR